MKIDNFSMDLYDSQEADTDLSYPNFHNYRDYIKWTYNTPNEPGFYWCRQYGRVRMVSVWRYKNSVNKPTQFFTNENGGTLVNDSELYADALWCGPLIPPDAGY